MLFALFFIFQHTKKIFIFRNVENCDCSLRMHQSMCSAYVVNWQEILTIDSLSRDKLSSETNKPMQLLNLWGHEFYFI